MNRIFMISACLSALLYLTGCGIGTIKRKVYSKNQNSLGHESLTRLTLKELKAIEVKLNQSPSSEESIYQYLVKCHSDDEYGHKLKLKLRDLLNKNRENPHYWTVLGGCNLVNKNYPATRYYYQLAKTKLNNVSRQSAKALRSLYLNNLAHIDLTQGFHKKAYDKWNKSLKLKNSYTALFNLAFLNLYFAKLKKSEQQFLNLLKNASNDPDVLLGMGIIHILKGQTNKALSYLSKVPKSHKYRSDIAIYRAIALYDNKQLNEAFTQLSNRSYTTNKHLRGLANPLKIKISKQLESEGND